MGVRARTNGRAIIHCRRASRSLYTVVRLKLPEASEDVQQQLPIGARRVHCALLEAPEADVLNRGCVDHLAQVGDRARKSVKAGNDLRVSLANELQGGL